jgi:predicted HicB family RNase H-like nuclease
MANRTVQPELRRIIQGFTLPENIKPKLRDAAATLGISMSQFVEEAIYEKINKIKSEITHEL